MCLQTDTHRHAFDATMTLHALQGSIHCRQAVRVSQPVSITAWGSKSTSMNTSQARESLVLCDQPWSVTAQATGGTRLR